MAPRLLSSSSDSDECCQTRFIQDDFRTLTAGVRTKACNRYIPEIREVLRNVCKEHKIYFAQTWAPCDQQFEGGCRVPTENQCVSVVQYDAVYTFHPAVTMLHASFYSLHWAKGQGHVRKAFMTNRPCLSLIKSATHHSPYYFVTHLDNSDFYYLHYSSAVAIHIKGKDNDTPSDYILEFFYHAFEELYTLASKLCSSLQDRFKSLRVVTNKDKEVDIVNLLEIESKQRLSRARTDSSTKDQQSNGIHEHQLLPDENPSGASAGGLQDCNECSYTRETQYVFRTVTARERTEACNRYLPEIGEVLWNVCEEYDIYFAQTWAPCDQQFEGGCRVPTKNQCVSVVQYDAFCISYPVDTMVHARFHSLHWAKGQGHVGKAFMTNRPCLSLIKYATHHSPYYFVAYFGYTSVVAIHIKGKDNDTPSDYILEFVYHNVEELDTLASKMCSSLQDRFKSLRVVTNKDKEVEIVNFLEIESKQRLSRARTDSSTKDQQSNGIHEHQLLPDENLSGASAGETSEERYTRVEKTINSLSDVPQDAAKITAGKSCRRARMKQDPAWKYCSELIKDKKNGPIKCSFCNLEIKGGGITRFKFHLLGRDLSKNIRKCPSVSPEAKAKMEEWLQKYNAKRND